MAIAAVTVRKKTGAYYTDAVVARFLTSWAVTTPTDRVLEPCFGEGVFLSAAIERLRQLGGTGDVVGVDIDPEAWNVATSRFPGIRLLQSDFFDLSRDMLGAFDVVVGNPPFVRYHHFRGKARERALAVSAWLTVRLPALASAWAPYLVAAASCLRPGGRLAMVVPYELTYAKYARPVVRFLTRTFGEVRCLTFDSPLFPDINENTVLLLCSGYGEATEQILVHRYDSALDLQLPLTRPVLSILGRDWADGAGRPRLLDLPTDCRALLTALSAAPQIRRLGDVARVGIGYVTGANDFFHLTWEKADELRLRQGDLRPAATRGSDIARAGLAYDSADRASFASADVNRVLLFHPTDGLSASAHAYVKLGESLEIDRRYKCRVRRPWYIVPGVRAPDMMLSVFATRAPRLVVNDAGVVVANGLLAVDQYQEAAVSSEHLAASAITTLAQLSAEVEGHALGGGALKFEPAEAKRWLLPCFPDVEVVTIREIDRLLRTGDFAGAVNSADDAFLIKGMGLSEEEVSSLRHGLAALRRLRSRPPRVNAGA